MFHSVLKCTLYARSSRSISFWYLSIENGGGVNGSRPCSLAKRAYIARIISWISPVCRALRVEVCRGSPRRSRSSRARTPLVKGLPRCAGACRPRVRAQRLEADRCRRASVGLLREHVAQRGVALHARARRAPSPAGCAPSCARRRPGSCRAAPRSSPSCSCDAGDARVEDRAHAQPRARGLRRCVAAPTMSRFAGISSWDSASLELRAGGFCASSASSPLTLASSAFCADTAKTCAGGIAEHLRAWSAPGARSRPRSRRRVLKLVPQAVDLVQDDQTAFALRGRIVADQVVVPHVDVGLGHAGVGGEDEQHRVRVGQEVERELGLGADRVQARRVEDDEALLQQRVREVDDRVAPARDVDRPSSPSDRARQRRRSSS